MIPSNIEEFKLDLTSLLEKYEFTEKIIKTIISNTMGIIKHEQKQQEKNNANNLEVKKIYGYRLAKYLAVDCGFFGDLIHISKKNKEGYGNKKTYTFIDSEELNEKFEEYVLNMNCQINKIERIGDK